MMHRELEQIERELEELAGMEAEALAAGDLESIRRAVLRLHYQTRATAFPYRAARLAGAQDIGDAFLDHILALPHPPRHITI